MIRHKNFYGLLLVLVFSLILPAVVQAHPAVYHGKHYQAGVTLLQQGKITQAIHELEHAVLQSPQGAYLRKLAEAYEANGQYQKAADTYYREAQVHLKRGDTDAYLVVKGKGDALSSEIQLFVQEDGTYAKPQNLAKYEPSAGLYIGAFVEYDKSVGPKNVKAFNQITGKNHAIYYTYHEYGNPFPVNWAAQVKAAGAAIQLSLEPNKGLDIVQDNAYLREFARNAKQAGVPIFLRFASEMNGNWVAWNGNPAKYIEKFRLVSQVMKEEAPNVAMVWAPNSVPQKEITKYYPGDQWVDWVGFNLYSVCFFNGDPNQPADTVNPLDLLDFVYKEYADQKPIMVAEYGATHYSTAGNLDATRFAVTKMNMLYQGVRMLYPRVKAIHWYSVNNLEKAHSADRRLNNFSLTENQKVLEAYKKMISDPYFLSQVQNGPFVTDDGGAKLKISPLAGMTVSSNGQIKGLGWVKTYDPYISKVVYKLDNKYLSESYQYPFGFTLDAGKLTSGKHVITAVAFDSKGREAARKDFIFNIK